MKQPEHNSYYEQKTLFITGFAGSGKSTFILDIVDKETLVLVPTHKAAEVLINKGIQNVYTIHAVLKLVPSLNENFRKKMTTKLRQVGATDLDKIKKVVIDEYSMINEEILNTLMSTLPDKADVYIVGDQFQLPPITGEPIVPWEPIIELTTQHRAKNPQGVELFMKFKDAIENYKSSPDVSHIPIELEWKKMFNPETDRILAFTNERVQALNQVVSGNKTFQNNDELLINGLYCVHTPDAECYDWLFPSCISKGKLLPDTKRESAVKKAQHDISKWHTNLGMYKTTVIELENKTYVGYYDANHYKTEKRLKKDVEKFQQLVIHENKLSLSTNIPDWCRQNRGAAYVVERGKAWSKYLAHKNYVFNLAYPFATTIYKAQGSEFSTVFIDITDMRRALSTEQYQRLMYVALSRAINKIIFI